MKKAIVTFLVSLLVLTLAFATTAGATIIDPTSQVYDYMDELYALCGLGKPSTNRPWSVMEMRIMLDRVDRSALSAVGLSLYEEINDVLEKGEKWNYDDFGFAVNLVASPELYFHSNEDYDLESDWVRGFAQRKPLCDLVFEFTMGDNFYTVSDIMCRQGRASYRDSYANYIGSDLISSDGYVSSYKVGSEAHYITHSWYFGSLFNHNMGFGTYDFDFIWPHRAVVAMSGNNWVFSINRDRMKIGDAHLGNLLVDDYSDFNDYMRLTFVSDHFKYDWYMMFFNTIVNTGETMTDEARMFLIHTLDFRILNRFNFKISENVMYKYSTFDLMFLNPAFIYHNLNNRGMFNAIAYLEATGVICRGLEAYVQYAMDQARAPNEGYNQSDSSGFIAGLEYTAETRKAVATAYGEFTCTTPLLYRRDIVDFTKVTRYNHQGSFGIKDGGGFYGHIPFFEFIGLQFGGDTEALKLGATYDIPGKFNAELYCLLLQHGEVTLFSSHNTEGKNEDDANLLGKTPSSEKTGNITRAVALSSSAEYDCSSFFNWPGISAYMELDWIGRWTYDVNAGTYGDFSDDVQLSMGMTIII